jgi:hypothetical protein
MRAYLTALTVIVSLAAAARADDKPKGPELPVTATIVAKTATYKLDLGGKTADDFKKELKDAEKSGKLPAPPAVEMTLELKNTSKEDVQVWVGGDPFVISLELKGTGAVTLKPNLIMTQEFRTPKAVKIEAGKTHSIPLTSLKAGYRGISELAYWTEPGEYTLSASIKTGISPAPKDIKAEDGFGMVTLKTEPIKIKVEAPK